MAVGDITKTAINTLVLDTYGTSSVIQPVSGDVYAVAYVGPDSDGWIATFSCTAAGVLTAIDTFEFETDRCSQYHLDFKRVDETEGTFAVVYRDGTGSYGGAGVLKTIGIMANGTILGIDATWQFATGAGFPKLLHRSGTVWIIFYDDTYTGQGKIGTTTINTNGTIGSAWLYSSNLVNKCRNAQIVHGTGNFYVCAFNNELAQGKIATMVVTDVGVLGAAWTNTPTQFGTSLSSVGRMLQLADGYIVVPYHAATAIMKTYSVTATGVLALVDTQSFGTSAPYSQVIDVSETMRALIYEEAGATVQLHTWDITDAGVITNTKQDYWAFSGNNEDPYIRYISGSVYLVTYYTSAGLTAMTFVISTSGTLYPTDATVRVTGIVHRYDRRKGIYQLEITLGDVTSVLELPYAPSAKRATTEKQQDQDTDPIVEEAVQEAIAKSKGILRRYENSAFQRIHEAKVFDVSKDIIPDLSDLGELIKKAKKRLEK